MHAGSLSLLGSEFQSSRPSDQQPHVVGAEIETPKAASRGMGVEEIRERENGE